MTIEGAGAALEDSEVMDLVQLAARVDWAAGEDTTRDWLVKQFGWEPSGRFSLRLPSGVRGSILGDEDETDGLLVWHTSWDPHHPDHRNLAFRRAANLREVLQQELDADAKIGQLDTGEAYYWDRPDGSRLWLDGEALRFFSPTVAEAQRFAQEHSERYASYGQDGEHA